MNTFNTEIISKNNWKVFINENKTELQFVNDRIAICCYAYYENSPRYAEPFFRFDRTVVSQYIQKLALRWAKKNNMISIYNR